MGLGHIILACAGSIPPSSLFFIIFLLKVGFLDTFYGNWRRKNRAMHTSLTRLTIVSNSPQF